MSDVKRYGDVATKVASLPTMGAKMSRESVCTTHCMASQAPRDHTLKHIVQVLFGVELGDAM